MNRHQLLRVATILVFVAIAVVAVIRFFPDTSRTERPEETTGELSVEEAIAVAGQEPITVRGFVFKGPESLPLRLCTGIERLDEPECLGPFVTLEGVNEASFDLRMAGKGDEARQYQRTSISILGVLNGTALQVQQILQ